jgi:hypothetical protein
MGERSHIFKRALENMSPQDTLYEREQSFILKKSSNSTTSKELSSRLSNNNVLKCPDNGNACITEWMLSYQSASGKPIQTDRFSAQQARANSEISDDIKASSNEIDESNENNFSGYPKKCKSERNKKRKPRRNLAIRLDVMNKNLFRAFRRQLKSVFVSFQDVSKVSKRQNGINNISEFAKFLLDKHGDSFRFTDEINSKSLVSYLRILISY